MKVDGILTGIQTTINYDPIKSVNDDASKAEKAAAAKEDDAKKKVAEETKKVSSEVYGDVLSKSADGDTTRAAKQSIDALSDGLVMPKNNDQEVTTSLIEPKKENPVLEAAIEDAKKDQREKQIDSLTGYTTNQLDSLYAQGKISRYDYDREVARRDELTQDKKPSALEEERAAAAEDKKENEDSKNTDAIKQQIEGNGAVNNEMAGLVNQQINTNLTGISIDAIQSADSDKLNLINQVVNGN